MGILFDVDRQCNSVSLSIGTGCIHCGLTDSINGLVEKYHDETAVNGRSHRFVLIVHPLADANSSKD
jgi:hypothetical protein